LLLGTTVAIYRLVTLADYPAETVLPSFPDPTIWSTETYVTGVTKILLSCSRAPAIRPTETPVTRPAETVTICSSDLVVWRTETVLPCFPDPLVLRTETVTICFPDLVVRAAETATACAPPWAIRPAETVATRPTETTGIWLAETTATRPRETSESPLRYR
jgi:hypothetical protein